MLGSVQFLLRFKPSMPIVLSALEPAWWPMLFLRIACCASNGPGQPFRRAHSSNLACDRVQVHGNRRNETRVLGEIWDMISTDCGVELTNPPSRCISLIPTTSGTDKSASFS